MASRSVPRWWDYVRKILRDYPAIPPGRPEDQSDDAKDREAVDRAIAATRQRPDGAERLELIRYVYWNRKLHRVKDAAPQLHISEATAKRWHGDFVRLVAKNRGFCVSDKDDTVKLS